MDLPSSAELLVLHAARLKGRVDGPTVARRYSLDVNEVEEILLDHEAGGMVAPVRFADIQGWSITPRGREKIRLLLVEELERAGARDVVERVHEAFVPLNERFLIAVTRWQVRPTPWDKMALNDHSDARWDDRVLEDLTRHIAKVRPLEERLTSVLRRFGGYADRLDAAIERADRGEKRWVDEPGIQSCHMVWFELHEDLLATLGINRGGATQS